MRRYVIHIYIICLATLLAACGEDRTYELEEKTQHNRWMLDVMRDAYLWGDMLMEYEPEWKDYFLTPDEFLKKLTNKVSQGDSWSYVETDTVVQDIFTNGHFNHINSYGFDFVVMNDPTGQTTKTFARVLTVYPNSPASESGLKRNDFISTFNDFKISQKNMAKLEKGEAITLKVQTLNADGEEYYLSDERTINIGESRYVEDIAFPVSRCFQVAGINVGYLMCTRLIASSPDKGNAHENTTPYKDALDQIMQQMKANEVNELVLDLRLCNYGTIDMAQRLASYVVNPKHIGEAFATTIYNTKYTDKNTIYNYDKQVNNLSLGRIFVIVSERTQGAAEWLIHGLKSSMGDEQVIVVGTETSGQNVLTQCIGHEYNLQVYPAVAYVASGNGDYEYGKIEPTEKMIETEYAFLSNYGETDEPLLSKVLELMLY